MGRIRHFFALSTEHPSFNAEYVPNYMALLHKYNMSEKTIFRCFTIEAAKAVGLHACIGSIVIGKKADIVLWTKSPFAYGATIHQMIIKGEIID